MGECFMERALGYIIGGVVAGAVLLAFGMLFGGALLGALSALFAFPVAAPMTTSAVLLVLGAGFISYRRKRRGNQDRS